MKNIWKIPPYPSSSPPDCQGFTSTSVRLTNFLIIPLPKPCCPSLSPPFPPPTRVGVINNKCPKTDKQPDRGPLQIPMAELGYWYGPFDQRDRTRAICKSLSFHPTPSFPVDKSPILPAKYLISSSHCFCSCFFSHAMAV